MIPFKTYKQKEFKRTYKTIKEAGTFAGGIIWQDESAMLYQDKKEFERDRRTPMVAKVFLP